MTQLQALSHQEFRQLEQEFKQIDIDGNNRLDRNELQNFLLAGGMDTEHCKQIIDEIFAAGDDDYDGYIDLNEFIELYLEIKNKLVTKQGEIINELGRLNQIRDGVHADFEKGKFSQRPQGGQKGNFSITIQRGQAFPAGQHLVVVQQAASTQQTNPVLGNNPVYDQTMNIQIMDDAQPVVITVFNTQNRLVGRTQIPFYNSDWDFTGNDNQRTLPLGPDNGMNTPQISVFVRYQEEEFARLERQAHEIQEQLEVNHNTLTQVNNFLTALNTPFGFLAIGQKVDDLVDFKDPKSELAKPYADKQKQMEKIFDDKARVVANKLGMAVIPWIKATFFVLYVQLMFTCFAMYHRADFLTLTIVAIGFYLIETLHNPRRPDETEQEMIRKKEKRFEVLMYAIIVSLIYDILWFFINNYSQDDGSPETGVKRFSLWMSYLSFIWRIVLLLVLWKDQIDFARIHHQYKKYIDDQTGGDQLSRQVY